MKNNKEKKLKEKLKNLIAFRKLLNEKLNEIEKLFEIAKNAISIETDKYDFEESLETLKSYRLYWHHVLKVKLEVENDIEKIKEKIGRKQ